MGVDDVAFVREAFALDRMTPATVAGLLWRLAGRREDRATARVVQWAQAVFGAAERSQGFEERGEAAVQIARTLRCPVGTLETVPAVNEYWDGSGHPDGKAGDEIPLTARIVGLAQAATIWAEDASPRDVADRLRSHSGGRFDPTVVDCATSELEEAPVQDGGAWLDDLVGQLRRRDPRALGDEPVPVPAVASVFAGIVDSKSPYTAGHSERVGALAGAMAEELGGPVSLLALAGLLHDLGKLAIPNTILDHPGSLDEAAWAVIRRHPADSARVLRAVAGWDEVARIAAVHHERPDGRGYHRELKEQDIPRFGTWLAAADSFDAMTADRPYRDGMNPGDALEELRRGAGTQFTHEAVETLEAVIEVGSVGGQDDGRAVA